MTGQQVYGHSLAGPERKRRPVLRSVVLAVAGAFAAGLVLGRRRSR